MANWYSERYDEFIVLLARDGSGAEIHMFGVDAMLAGRIQDFLNGALAAELDRQIKEKKAVLDDVTRYLKVADDFDLEVRDDLPDGARHRLFKRT